MTTLAEVCITALRSLVPPPRLQLAEWIQANLVLPSDVSAQPGPIRQWPWQIEIANAISDPGIERISLCKPVRVGFTLLTAAVASYVANEPCSVLVLLPTESDARDFVVSDLEPTFNATPAVRGLLSSDMADGEARNTLLHRRYGGGSIKAPRNLRRHNAKVLLIDECDAMQVSAEGSPIKLAERRTLSFPDRKIVLGSTPLYSETSHVLKSYSESDQRVFEIPCSVCGVFVEVLWEHIEWPPGEPTEAAFRCPHCHELVHERHKPNMVSAGRWRITRPEVQGHAGFRLNSLISLLANASWGKLAVEFLAAKDDPSLLQVFVNTYLGQGWTEAGSEIDETTLRSRAERFDLNYIPASVLIITIGADTQDDRIEAVVCGWTRHGECLVLGYFTIWGSFTDDATWDEFDELLKTRWKHPFGGLLKVDATVVDAGDGDHFDQVLKFANPRMGRRVFAGKGMAGNRPGFAMAKGKRIGGKLAIIGVDVLKSTIFEKLQRGSTIRFSDSLEPVFFEQLASERRVIRYVRGQPVRRFERISTRARAEALDAMVYAFAARQAVTVSYDGRERALHGEPKKSFAVMLPR